MGAAPALAEGTTSIEPAGEAEKAITAKLEALVPQTPGGTRCEVEGLPREGKRKAEETLPQAPPPKAG